MHDQLRDDSDYLWVIQSSNSWYSGYNIMDFTNHLILEFEGFYDIPSDFEVGDYLNSNFNLQDEASNISYQWQVIGNDLEWKNIENENSLDLYINNDLYGKNVRLAIDYEINDQAYTNFSDPSPVIYSSITSIPINSKKFLLFFNMNSVIAGLELMDHIL